MDATFLADIIRYGFILLIGGVVIGCITFLVSTSRNMATVLATALTVIFVLCLASGLTR